MATKYHLVYRSGSDKAIYFEPVNLFHKEFAQFLSTLCFLLSVFSIYFTAQHVLSEFSEAPPAFLVVLWVCFLVSYLGHYILDVYSQIQSVGISQNMLYTSKKKRYCQSYWHKTKIPLHSIDKIEVRSLPKGYCVAVLCAERTYWATPLLDEDLANIIQGKLSIWTQESQNKAQKFLHI